MRLLAPGHRPELVRDVRHLRALRDELSPMQEIGVGPSVDVQCSGETFIQELGEHEPDLLIEWRSSVLGRFVIRL